MDWGPAEAQRVVVCVHGYSGNARDFDYLARALAADTRVICIDIAGRGESDWLRSPLEYNFAQFLADINGLLASLKLKHVDWVGTSMGGLLGMLLASQPVSPVRSLVLNDVGAYLPADALRAIARNLQLPAHFASLDDVEAHVRHSHRDWGDLTGEQWRHLAMHAARRTDDGYRLHFDPQITRLLQPFPLTPGIFLWDAWYRVRCPVLLLRGERSAVLPASVARAMIDAKPDTLFAEFADCGHVPALMDEEQIGVVRNFLAGPVDKAQWHRLASSSSRASSRTPTRSETRSRTFSRSGPASSPT
ncbi:MAG TPA: alpha/beta hydrolase [Usitatibacter sp.]|nr:alpha/beta hydrolase [Usitatibacter sp.]